jgi:hypothetical protein
VVSLALEPLASQVGVLWSIEQNRQILILAAAIFVQMALACGLAIYVIKRFQDDEAIMSRHAQVKAPTGESKSIQVHPVNLKSIQPVVSSLLGAEQEVQDHEVPASLTHDKPVTQIPPHMCAEEDEQALGETLYHEQLHPGADLVHREEDKSGSVSSGTDARDSISIEIRLLKNVRMDLYVRGKRYPIEVDTLNSRARHLIAYIASHQGSMVKLDEMRTHVFGSEEADLDQVQNAFSTAKRDIRRRIGEAVERANSEAGEQVLPDDLDIFALAKNRKYSLSEYCTVLDLSLIEQQSRIIEQAENQLVDGVPEHVKDACDALISAYTGDFIEDLLTEDPDAIDPWVQSWAREPFTRYRDSYLQALLYAGEYEYKAGDTAVARDLKREHYAHAARLFVQGAMAACNSRVRDGRFDLKVFFKADRRAGPHVTLSEQLIRCGITSYGKVGNSTLADRAYGAYEQQMLRVLGRAWTARPETVKALEEVLGNTDDWLL